MLPIVLTVAVAAAIVIMGAVLALSGGGDDSVASVTSDDIAVSTDLASTAPSTVNASPSAAPPTAPVPGRIARWQAHTQPEAIRNDAEALATVNQCSWP